MRLHDLQRMSKLNSKKSAMEICKQLNCPEFDDKCPGNPRCGLIAMIMAGGKNAMTQKKKKKEMYKKRESQKVTANG